VHDVVHISVVDRPDGLRWVSGECGADGKATSISPVDSDFGILASIFEDGDHIPE
jgi:hypothetical protein